MSDARNQQFTRIFFALFYGCLLPLFFVLVDHWLAVWLVWPGIHGNQNIYYHHGYSAYDTQRSGWGERATMFYTNSLGMKDAGHRKVSAEPAGKRLVFLGDSFTEGVGQEFENTFAGRFALAEAKPDLEVLNAGVASFSPRLYFLRAKQLLEVEKIRFDELYVFIDISDIQDELNYDGFEPEENPSYLRRARVWLHRNSFTYRLVPRLGRELWGRIVKLRAQEAPSESIAASKPEPAETNPLGVIAPSSEQGRANGVVGMAGGLKTDSDFRSSWTLRSDLMKRGGEKGMELATENMDRLYQLCRQHGVRLSIAVYPWPQQIRAGDLNSLQAVHWKAFAAARSLNFLNYFPLFVGSRVNVDEILKTDFNGGDVHWNAKGHLRIARGLCDPQVNQDASRICREEVSVQGR